jgi:hypothetical protein
MNYFKLNGVQDLHDWINNFTYDDKDEIKLYMIPMIKFYSVKYPDVMKQYVYEYRYLYNDQFDYGTPEWILIEYVKFKHKQKTGSSIRRLQT